MSIAIPTRPAVRTQRDRSVDAVRAVLLIAVVLLHAGMVGVSRDASGTPVLENAMEHWAGFGPVTWVMQVMPLFFILGGFASFTQYTRDSAKGVNAATYIAGRMRRLQPTVAVAIAATAVFLSVLTLAGAPLEVVQTAGFRIGQPLWFIAVYLGITALVPVMVSLHTRAPRMTFALLAIGVVAVDIARGVTGNATIGLINLAFVWLLLQQIGFALADGTLARVTARTRLMLTLLAVAAIAGLMLTGAAPADLIAALNPPMAVLVLVGVVQVGLFVTFRSSIDRFAQRSGVQEVVAWINARSLTIYAWHMLVVIALAGALLLLPLELPVPLSLEWWLSRPVWFALVSVLVTLVVSLVAGIELRRERTSDVVSMVRAVPSVLVGTIGVLLALLFGMQAEAWTAGAAFAALAFALVRPQRREVREISF